MPNSMIQLIFWSIADCPYQFLYGQETTLCHSQLISMISNTWRMLCTWFVAFGFNEVKQNFDYWTMLCICPVVSFYMDIIQWYYSLIGNNKLSAFEISWIARHFIAHCSLWAMLYTCRPNGWMWNVLNWKRPCCKVYLQAEQYFISFVYLFVYILLPLSVCFSLFKSLVYVSSICN